MSYDDPDDDEDWYDEGDVASELDDDETGHCRECNGPVYEFSDKCPACGYWLSATDRRQMWSGDSKPTWIKVTALVVLAILLLGLFGIGSYFF
jgi:ribosomal protein L37E